MTNLEANTTGLEEVLAMVNALPDDAELVEQATPSISVSTGGLITASATQEAGKVEAGTKSATKQLTVQAAQTITPGTSNKTIASGRYLTGTQTIKGDANLIAENIKSGVSIFDVLGTLEAGGGEVVFTQGTFTPADATSDVVVEHGLGVVPTMFVVLAAVPNTFASSKVAWVKMLIAYKYFNTFEYFGVLTVSPSSNTLSIKQQTTDEVATGTSGSIAYYYNIDNEKVTFKQTTISSTYGMGEGVLFKWIAVV